MSNPDDTYASERLRDGLKACETDPVDALLFVIGYVASYNPGISAECSRLVEEAFRK